MKSERIAWIDEVKGMCMLLTYFPQHYNLMFFIST